VDWAFVRREWGAVTFVLTVIAGLIVVPLALYFANVGPGAVLTPVISPSPIATSPTPSASPTASPKTSPSPTATPKKSPSPSPSK
jgi:hypothetical protein